MHLTLKKRGLEISFSTERELSLAQEKGIVLAMNEAIDNIVDGEIPISNENIKPIVTKTTTMPMPVTERPAFRNRLPNNVVDIESLTIQQAVTENALVRCPECGQSHAIVVAAGGCMYLMRKDYKANEFITITEIDARDKEALVNMCCDDNTDRLKYFNDLQQFDKMSDYDFAVDNDTEIFCPVCRNANASFIKWKDAYENPLKYFDTEYLCDVCGGELTEKVVKRGSYTHCEKCGFEAPTKKENQ